MPQLRGNLTRLPQKSLWIHLKMLQVRSWIQTLNIHVYSGYPAILLSVWIECEFFRIKSLQISYWLQCNSLSQFKLVWVFGDIRASLHWWLCYCNCLMYIVGDRRPSMESNFCQAMRQLCNVPSSQLCVRLAAGGDPTYAFNVRLTGEEVHGTSMYWSIYPLQVENCQCFKYKRNTAF